MNKNWVNKIGKPTFLAIKEMVDAYNNAETDEEREGAEQVIYEDPLSVRVRSDWYCPGEEVDVAEYEILLGWGGPAMRIIGELDNWEPVTASLEVQDWWEPWKEYTDADENVLLSYARHFCFDL